MLWRNRALKRLSSIPHETKRAGLIECPLECLKTFFRPPYPSLSIWWILRSHRIALYSCGSLQWSSQTSSPAILMTLKTPVIYQSYRWCQRYAKGLLTCSLWTSWIKIARYPAYRVETESSTPLKKQPYHTSRTSSLRTWMKNEYLWLYYSTCLKLSTASNMTPFYRGGTYWVCVTPL